MSQEQAYPSTHLQTNKTVFLGAYSMDLLDSQQKLGVGDRIFLRVIEDQEEPISQTITDAGEIYVPELGLVSAAGKTCRQLAFELKAKLEQTAYYQATVIAGIESLNKTLSGRKVFITGQVRVTSPMDIPAGESWTVSKIIMRAGGFTEFADKKRVRLIRGSSKAELSRAYTINVSEIWDKARTDRDLLVEPGDLIFVPARVINF